MFPTSYSHVFSALDIHPPTTPHFPPPTQGSPPPQPSAQQPPASLLHASSEDAIHSLESSGTSGKVQMVVDMLSSPKLIELSSEKEMESSSGNSTESES